jgi:hypothetical protein
MLHYNWLHVGCAVCGRINLTFKFHIPGQNGSFTKPYESPKLTFKKTKKNMLPDTLFMLDPTTPSPKNNWQLSKFFIKLSFTNIFASKHKLKLFLDSYGFYKYLHRIEEHCMTHVAVSFFTAGVAYLNRCGFRWFPHWCLSQVRSVVK